MCPELRDRAIAALPDFVWQSFVDHARVRAMPAPVGASTRASVLEAAAHVRVWLTYAVAAVMVTVAATLALTLIANATRG